MPIQDELSYLPSANSKDVILAYHALNGDSDRFREEMRAKLMKSNPTLYTFISSAITGARDPEESRNMERACHRVALLIAIASERVSQEAKSPLETSSLTTP